MPRETVPGRLADEQGVALPLALLTLLILSMLVIAFGTLATTEPVIANNQLMVAQARAIAEAGVERAIWGLNHSTDPQGIPDPLGQAPAPYDGSQLVMLSVGGVSYGGFRVWVTNGGVANERQVVADGWVPNDAAAARKAKQRIMVTLQKVRFPDPPAGLAVRGELQVGGNTQIDARGDSTCGNKAGTWTTGLTTISGNARIWGQDENETPNQPTDVLQNKSTEIFDQFAFTDADLDLLKAIAKSRGTYYQGTVTFNSSNRLPNGLVFIDTVSGGNIGPSTPTTDFASVSIHGGAPADPSGVFSGWLIVNGGLAISGSFQMRGMVCVQNDLSYTGTGTGQIVGAVITRNIRNISSTTIDTNIGGSAAIVYHCAYARDGGGQVPQGWLIKAGTYKEVSG